MTSLHEVLQASVHNGLTGIIGGTGLAKPYEKMDRIRNFEVYI
jgi:hypothetical protein